MVKKIFALALMLFGLAGLAQAQTPEKDFPNKACKSVDVVYLSSKDSLRLFAVQNQGKGKWKLTKDSETLLEKFRESKVEFYPLADASHSPETFEFTSDHVIQRFDFGVDDNGYKVFKKYCVEFQEAIPIGQKKGELAKSVGGDSGIDLVKNYVAMIYRVGVTLLSLVCVLIIVVSGIQISAAGVDSGAVEQAKGRIAQALLSLVLLFASAMILKAINPGFFL